MLKKLGIGATLLFLSIIVLSSAPVFAEYDFSDIDKASKAYKVGNFREAAKWYRKAAERGMPMAQYELGILYMFGEGVPQDYKESISWHRKAAGQGMAVAQYELGSIYYRGSGVTQDYSEAKKWFQMAAEKGHEQAQYCLGVMYFKGHGAKQDYINAYAWLTLSTTNRRDSAKPNREMLERLMTSSQLVESNKLFRESLAKYAIRDVE